MNRESVWYRRTSHSSSGLLLFVLCGLSIMLSTGCGSTQSPPTTIAFAAGQMAPPSSAMANSTVQFAAIVNDDSANLGVSWLLTWRPTVAGCGSLSRRPRERSSRYVHRSCIGAARRNGYNSSQLIGRSAQV